MGLAMSAPIVRSFIAWKRPSRSNTPTLSAAALAAAGTREARGQVDHHTADDHVRGHIVLVGVGAEGIHALFLRRLKDAQPCGVGILKDDVHAPRDLRERLFLAGAHIIPVADVRRNDFNLGIDRLRATGKGFEAGLHRRELGAGNEPQLVGGGHRAGNHSRLVRGLLEQEGYPCAPYWRKFSSNSAGVLVWICEICAPNESRNMVSPS